MQKLEEEIPIGRCYDCIKPNNIETRLIQVSKVKLDKDHSKTIKKDLIEKLKHGYPRKMYITQIL